jgi:hypothetical protein
VLVLANLGEETIELPRDADVLVSSEPISDGRVPTDVAVWARW